MCKENASEYDILPTWIPGPSQGLLSQASSKLLPPAETSCLIAYRGHPSRPSTLTLPAVGSDRDWGLHIPDGSGNGQLPHSKFRLVHGVVNMGLDAGRETSEEVLSLSGEKSSVQYTILPCSASYCPKGVTIVTVVQRKERMVGGWVRASVRIDGRHIEMKRKESTSQFVSTATKWEELHWCCENMSKQ